MSDPTNPYGPFGDKPLADSTPPAPPSRDETDPSSPTDTSAAAELFAKWQTMNAEERDAFLANFGKQPTDENAVAASPTAPPISRNDYSPGEIVDVPLFDSYAGAGGEWVTRKALVVGVTEVDDGEGGRRQLCQLFFIDAITHPVDVDGLQADRVLSALGG